FWIAYEHDLLPYLTGDFLEHVRSQLADREVTPPPPDFAADPRRKELEKLDAKLANARERFLEAPPAVAKGLLAKLEAWGAERRELARQLDATAGGPGQNEYARLVEWWTQYIRDFWAGNPVALPASPAEELAAWEDALIPAPVRDFLANDKDAAAAGFRYGG